MPDYSFDPGTGKSYTRGIRFPLFHRQPSRALSDASRPLLLAIYHLRLLCGTSRTEVYMRVNSGIVNTLPSLERTFFMVFWGLG